MNNLQEKLSDIVYAVAQEKIMHEEGYNQIIELLKKQKIEYEAQGRIPTMDLLINDLEDE